MQRLTFSCVFSQISVNAYKKKSWHFLFFHGSHTKWFHSINQATAADQSVFVKAFAECSSYTVRRDHFGDKAPLSQGANCLSILTTLSLFIRSALFVAGFSFCGPVLARHSRLIQSNTVRRVHLCIWGPDNQLGAHGGKAYAHEPVQSRELCAPAEAVGLSQEWCNSRSHMQDGR